jgi:DNA-binding MarR family transcriptional regulator
VRSPHPCHANVLELDVTEPGREVLRAGRERAEPVEKRILDAFSSRELGTLRGLLARWSEAAERKESES